MRGIDCAFEGQLIRDAEPRTAKSGTRWTKLSLAVDLDAQTEFVAVSAFGELADEAARLRKGVQVYVEGRLKLNRFSKSDGTLQTTLAIAAWRIVPMRQIGRRRPPKSAKSHWLAPIDHNGPEPPEVAKASVLNDLVDPDVEIPFCSGEEYHQHG